VELLSERFVRSVEEVIGSVRASAFTVHYKSRASEGRAQKPMTLLSQPCG
jgi:nucleoside-triphosphatase THEP1